MTTAELMAEVQDALGHLDQMDTRFATLIDRYEISFDDATHFVFCIGHVRRILENMEVDE